MANLLATGSTPDPTGVSSLALALFPLVRPFFPFDPRTPAETLAGASRPVTSASWLIAHYLALVGFVLLLCALPALYTRLASTGIESRARWAMLLSGVGVALILPTLGVELYALPAIGRLFLDGNPSVASAVSLIYLNGAALVMVLGLLLLAIGAIILATASAEAARSRSGRESPSQLGSRSGVRSSRRPSGSSTAC